MTRDELKLLIDYIEARVEAAVAQATNANLDERQDLIVDYWRARDNLFAHIASEKTEEVE